MFAPDRLERGKTRFATGRTEQRQFSWIKSGPISRRSFQGAHRNLENAGETVAAQSFAETAADFPDRCRPKMNDSTANNRKPGMQWPSERAHHRVDEADHSDFVPGFPKPSRHLESNKASKGITAQI